MKFHREGYPTLGLTLLIGAIFLAVAWFLGNSILFKVVAAFFVFLLIVVLQFFRDPSRNKPAEDDGLFYTPADGKIVVIEKTTETEYLKKECIQVSVFMSPLNVHINRNPTSGEVLYEKYHPGKYLAAWNPKSSTENERWTTVYGSKSGPIVIRQIAGALARRIVNNLKKGDQVKQSEEMGFIKFGSRVDIFLPVDAQIMVKEGDVVRSPMTLIAKL